MEQPLNKKRIDHRHHAMDAIVIACASRNHVNLLSNEASVMKDNDNRYALSCLLRRQEEEIYNGKSHKIFREFILPWDSFAQDVENTLRDIIVSFKQNTRIVTQGINRYTVIENGQKKTKKQEGEIYSVRKSLHKETVFGLVNLRFKKEVTLKAALENVNNVVNRDLRAKLKEMISEGKNEKQIKAYFAAEKDAWSDINLSKIEIYYYTNDTANERYYATRKAIDTSYDRKTIENSVTDIGIQKILLRHLEENENKPELAFSPEGLMKMNENIVRLNGGVPHKPIYKVRKYELANKYAVGHVGNKNKKFVEGAKGTNLFMAFYATTDEEGNTTRSYVTVPLRTAIESQIEGGSKWRETMDAKLRGQGLVAEGAELLWILSPGDLVYLPTDEELKSKVYSFDSDRIYKFVSCTENAFYCVKSSVAKVIIDKFEFSPKNKMERAITGEMIKEICVPIKTDRLGNII